jgi:quercetin dioxygenase-like cupin family protein
MKTRTLILAVLLLGIAVSVNAQRGRSSRDILQRADASVGGRDVVTAIHVYEGAVTENRHTHPGDLSGYVIAGTVTLTLEGQSPVTLIEGHAFFVPSGVAHNVTSLEDARIVATYIVAKGQPLSIPAR